MTKDDIIRMAREIGFADGVAEIVGLEGFANYFADNKKALEAALEQQQAEPVVFYRCNGCGHAYEQVHPTSCDCMGAGGFDRVEYFTTPPAAKPEQVDCPRCGHVCSQRPWQGLTDEDVNRESAPITSQMKLAFHAGMYVAQKILKERNND